MPIFRVAEIGKVLWFLYITVMTNTSLPPLQNAVMMMNVM